MKVKEKEILKMKKVEFSKVYVDDDNAKTVDVTLDGDTYGKFKFGDEEFGTQKGVWILWPDDIDDAVTYSDDLQESEDTLQDELENADED